MHPAREQEEGRSRLGAGPEQTGLERPPQLRGAVWNLPGSPPVPLERAPLTMAPSAVPKPSQMMGCASSFITNESTLSSTENSNVWLGVPSNVVPEYLLLSPWMVNGIWLLMVMSLVLGAVTSLDVRQPFASPVSVP